MLRIDSNRIDTVIFPFTIVMGIGGFFSFNGWQEVNVSVGEHPFRQIMINSGSSVLAVLQVALAGLLLIALIIRIFKAEQSPYLLIRIMITASIALGLLPWMDLWYGSTLYYGNISEGPKPLFPISSLVYFIYPIWLFQEKGKLLFFREFAIRMAVSVLVGIVLTLFFNFVFGDWVLWHA